MGKQRIIVGEEGAVLEEIFGFILPVIFESIIACVENSVYAKMRRESCFKFNAS